MPELREATAKAFCPVETFGLTPECDWCAGDILWHDEATEFRVAYRGNEVARIRIPVAGRHNVLDALAAIALAYGRGVECDAIERALATFQSVRRRMEIKGEAGGVLVVEDFAHHPTAIRLTLEAARTRWPGRKIWAAVEPRSNTMRRKIFQDALPDALALADAVLFGPVNRAQLLAEEDRLSPEAICRVAVRARARRRQGVRFRRRNCGASRCAGANSGDLVLIMSNGSFDGLTAKLLEQISTRAPVPAHEATAAPGFVARWLWRVVAVCVSLIAARPASATIQYRVSLAHPEQPSLRVTMTIPVRAAKSIVAMPAWNALYQIRDFAYRVRDVTAACAARSMPSPQM